ncbi:prepilin-type N-terminal cleavage/methylation domain-containing protein [Alcanivorax sp. DP30]|uniref:prepilin-type N-terminal cleavage/methylation domain-containing protein n=1 Tax=Alcanivorax sp. DP30 TaxID=2606217 RepID=UPI00137229E4|nr:prepilin-type N-terminal cleavage/methylation domain-containing protein [Alcanivorax sp. DP30]MZR61740.1 prepilin-type N-terminal cleavage/methylation domain-containing protein [Alcanivorax sp. DP30]
MISAARQTGFTLLEILVVVMLVGLLTAVIAGQGNWTLSEDGLDEESARLYDTLELLNERSLFSGQLLALRLSPDGWTPLAYDRDERDFLPIDDSSLKPRTLAPNLSVEWQVDALEDEQVTLSDMAESLIKDDLMATPEGLSEQAEIEEGSEQRTESSDSNKEKTLPQIFFFPSGEVTPVTVSLLSGDELDSFRRWQVSALGQVTDPDAEPEDEVLEETP